MDHIAGNLVDSGCGYCSHSLEDGTWDPHWDDSGDQYYKAKFCSGCGTKNWVRLLGFETSGHDTVLNEEETELESVLRKISER